MINNIKLYLVLMILFSFSSVSCEQSEKQMKTTLLELPQVKDIGLQSSQQIEIPDLQLPDMSGNFVSLRSYKGKPLILFFWTTWCPSCRRAMSDLNNLYRQLDEQGIVLLSINLQESGQRIRRFLKYYSVEFKILLDANAKLAYYYNLIGVPTYVLIDKKGKVRFNNHYFPFNNYQELLLKD